MEPLYPIFDFFTTFDDYDSTTCYLDLGSRPAFSAGRIREVSRAPRLQLVENDELDSH